MQARKLEAPRAGAKSEVTLERRGDGQLWLSREGESVAVWVRRCFPWSAPSRYLSLRDPDDEEVALVRDPALLDPESRAALEEELHEAGFVLEVTALEEVEEDYEIRCWRVRTRGGPRSFQTRLDAWPRRTKEGGLLVEDVSGDLYRIPPPARLDARSRRLLWAFID